MKAAAAGRRDGRYGTGCRLSLVLWRKRRSRDVRSLCVLGRGASQHRHSTQWEDCQQAHPSLEKPRENGCKVLPPNLPGKLAVFLKLPSKRRMERISSYSWWFQTQKQGQPLSCERKRQASMGWRWSQASVWKPFVRAALSEPC